MVLFGTLKVQSFMRTEVRDCDPGVRPTPGLTSSTQVVCVCVRAYTSTHTPTTLTPAKIEKYTRQNPYLYPCQNIASHASNKR